VNRARFNHSLVPPGADSAAAAPAAASLPATQAFQDSRLDATQAQGKFGLGRWYGWRLRVLVTTTLALCLAVFGLARWLAHTPALAATPGAATSALAAATAQPLSEQERERAFHTAPRWQPDDHLRQAHLVLHQSLAQSPQAGPRGFAGLGLVFWLACGLALALALLVVSVALARPHGASLLYTLAGLSQAASLVMLGCASVIPQGWPPVLASIDLPLRAGLDLWSAGCLLMALCWSKRGDTAGRLWAVATGAVCALLLLALALDTLPKPWLTAQLGLLGLVAAGLVYLLRLQGPQPDPVARVMLKLLAAVMMVALATQGSLMWWPEALTTWAPWLWQSALLALLLMPLLLGSRQAMREFALLAGISAVAASLDLLFITVFALEPFASLALVVFIALGLYAGLRQWLMDRLLGSQMLTAERIFEQLYRAAREVQAQPQRHVQVLSELLRKVFEPLEVRRSAKAVVQSRVAGGGSSLLVPLLVPLAPPSTNAASSSPVAAAPTLVLRFARRGQRIFTREDAALADRVVEQLRRAVAYDMAVERGRSEERLRIAQDLHDDIGARLLTLMYQAPHREMEDYLRHTLKDLKTLTRGLAASEHRLSHAAAEWKADLVQRLSAARIELDWVLDVDEDRVLTMVQWQALTRILRELVTNTIHHAQATRVRVRLHLRGAHLNLSVADNGVGGDPQAWAPGLGVGGVRKRVKQLGGEVQWRPGSAPEGGGILCEVRLTGLAGQI
jgi:signal transduction histidine kinase